MTRTEATWIAQTACRDQLRTIDPTLKTWLLDRLLLLSHHYYCHILPLDETAQHLAVYLIHPRPFRAMRFSSYVVNHTNSMNMVSTERGYHLHLSSFRLQLLLAALRN
jgi:hypothetical protein